jgi:molybdate transport system permease protein
VTRARATRSAAAVAAWGLGGALVAFLVLPLVALVATSGPAALRAGLRHPATAPALALSLLTSAISLAVLVLAGTPLAWWLARTPTRMGRAIDTLTQLPVVTPPAVAGLALLLTFGRQGVAGAWLARLGIDVSFSTAAVVMAQLFVSAPFFLQAARTAFAGIDRNLLFVARSLGAGPARLFFTIAVPLARPGLLAGAAMSWARALGEFGATLMFAGNLPGRSQTLPLAIYTALESDLRAAQALAVLLVIVALVLLLALRGRATAVPLARPEAPRS